MNISDIWIRKESIGLFRIIAEDLYVMGYSEICPSWDETMVGFSSESKCDICKEFFPDIGPNESNCPCTKYQSNECLEFINTILIRNENIDLMLTGIYKDKAIESLDHIGLEHIWNIASISFKMEAGKSKMDLNELKMRIDVLIKLEDRIKILKAQ